MTDNTKSESKTEVKDATSEAQSECNGLLWEPLPKIKIIDPPDCGCTDCITEYSKPINYCTKQELLQMHWGVIPNASGCTTEVEVKISYA
jgi:hypothetical protein